MEAPASCSRRAALTAEALHPRRTKAWGAWGGHLRNCTGRGEVLVAGTRLTIDDCRFDHMTFAIGRQRRRGTPLAATVLIDNSQGSGVWRMVDCRMKTSHIQNSSFEQIVNDSSECEA